MKKINIKQLVNYCAVAAIYVVLTVLLGEFSYGPIQFRVAEALVLLCFFNKKYFIPLVLGCFLSNILGSYGILDALLGTTATALSLLCIMYSKNIIVASIFPVIFNGLIIGLELTILTDINFWFNFATVSLGEVVSVCVFGVILFSILRKNKGFMEFIDANQNITHQK